MIIKHSQAERETKALETAYIKNVEKAYQQSLDEIEKKLQRYYSKFGVKGVLTESQMAKMTTFHKRRVTRLESLRLNIGQEINSLNRGKPQQMRAFLTDVYQTNYVLTGKNINTFTNMNMSFNLPNRQTIYNSTIRPMTKIALEDNSTAIQMAIRRDLTRGVVQGTSIQETAKSIEKSLKSNANSAIGIARTETTGIKGMARVDVQAEARDKYGIRLKKVWSASPWGFTRESHANLDGTSLEIEEVFDNGLMYPGDQNGIAAEVVNCRCSLYTEVLD